MSISPIVRLYHEGYTNSAIAIMLNTTRQNVSQTLYRHIGENQVPRNRGVDLPQLDHLVWLRTRFLAIRSRAGKAGILFTLTNNDIQEMLPLPSICPILGIPLEYGGNGNRLQHYSPQIDRLIPSLGYIPGNITIISSRANSIKTDATIEELEKLYRWCLAEHVRRV